MKALLLIDIQQGFEDLEYWGGDRNNPDAEKNARILLEFFRQKNWPRFIIQHDSIHDYSPLFPGKKGHNLHHLIDPLENETIIHKQTNSAFVNTDLGQRLRDLDVEEIVVAGLTTEHCVSTNVRHAADIGFAVIVVSDATANFAKMDHEGKPLTADMIHRVELASLKDEFAQIMDTSTILKLFANH